MATFEKEGTGGSGEEVSAEFLRKLDSLKKKDNGSSGNPKASGKALADDEQPPAELLRKLEALKKGAGAGSASTGSPGTGPSGPSAIEPGASAELLRKLDAIQRGGPMKTADVESQDRPEGAVSPELLRKLNAIAARKPTSEKPAVPAPAREAQAGLESGSIPSTPPSMAGEGAIEKAMELMRQLPINDQNVELMMQVVKSTLESFNINIDGIIADAAKKRRDLEHRIQSLQQEVAQYEEEIRKRTGVIHGLRRQYEEITLVGDRLLSGQKRARQGNAEIGSHLSDAELWGADDDETSAALDAIMPGTSPRE